VREANEGTFLKGRCTVNRTRRKALEDVMEQLEFLANEEQEAFDNMPESVQYGERGEQMQENVNQLEEAVELVRSVIEEG
jgi:hypothetical protein